MGITRIRGLLAIAVAGLLLAGCASTEPEETAINEPTEVEPSITRGKEDTTPKEVVRQEPKIGTAGEITIIDIDELTGESTTDTLDSTFYFDFDQAIVKRMGHGELDRHASFLKEFRSYRVRLEGHADERGTREYNLALGERRSNAIRAYLVAQGVSRTQLEVVSFGEEKPAEMGSGESSWAKNRRVEFIYRK